MTLVDVPHRRLNSLGGEEADSAHPEHQLLAEPHFPTPDVEGVCDRPVGGLVVRDIGVEEDDRCPPHLQAPRRRQHGPTGELD